MGKKELGSVPLFKIFFKKMNVLVDRKNRIAAVRAMDECKERLLKGESVVIFPEGSIPDRAPKMKKFKNGAFKLAIETGLPIVPVTYKSNYKRLSEGAWWKACFPGKVEVVIHEPIDTSNKSEEDLVNLSNQVFEIIVDPIKHLQ